MILFVRIFFSSSKGFGHLNWKKQTGKPQSFISTWRHKIALSQFWYCFYCVVMTWCSKKSCRSRNFNIWCCSFWAPKQHSQWPREPDQARKGDCRLLARDQIYYVTTKKKKKFKTEIDSTKAVKLFVSYWGFSGLRAVLESYMHS